MAGEDGSLQLDLHEHELARCGPVGEIGIDVAGRALAPRVRLHPGFVRFPLGLPVGLARNTFTTITSLLPGTVPCGEDDGVLVYHCLDTTQPVVDQLLEEERRLAGAVVPGRRYD